MVALINDNGWSATLKRGDLLACGAGDILVAFAPLASWGLHWGVASGKDADIATIRVCEATLAQFGALKDAGYAQWVQLLKDSLVEG